MNSFQERMRHVMERENLTYSDVANLANVSTQAVYKWLHSGLITDEKARVIAQEIGVDWIWLKHGVSRVSNDLLLETVEKSSNNLILVDVGKFEIVAIGKSMLSKSGLSLDDVLGKTIFDFLPNSKGSIESIKRGHKLLVMLGDSVEYSYRFNIQNNGKETAVEVTGRAITTDNDGNTYSLEELLEVEPDGTEDSYKSFKLRKLYSVSLTEDELLSVQDRFPDYPWLADFLRS